VWFKAPANGATVSGVLNLGTSCYVNAFAATRVAFFLDSTALNTDSNVADGMQCVLDTSKFANGTHQLKAVAYDASGKTDTDIISINIQNTAAPVNKAPSVAFAAPTTSGPFSGVLPYAVNATDDKAVTKVDFFLDSTALATKTAAPWGGSLDTKTLKDGTYVLKAVAYDAEGLSTASLATINVKNAAPVATTPAPLPGTTIGVWFKAPANGATVSGVLNLGTSCYVNAFAATRVAFFLDSTALNTDTNVADGMQCVLDTTKFANGAHQMKAVAYDASGKTDTDIINININNAAATPGGGTTPPNTPPTVSFVAPTASQTVSGMLAYSANAGDDKAVTKVIFMADSTTLATKTAAPWTGSLDTKSLPDGSHKLIAVAFDAEGLSTTAQVAINVKNAASGPTLPAGGKAVTTFESIGLYWTPPTKPGADGCIVQYKKSADSAWQPALNMWYDSRNNECRGSIVQVSPGTAYDVQMGLGTTYAVQLSAQTWSEQFPIAQTITLPAGTVTQPLAITQGGSASGYILYQANPAGTTIDVQNAYQQNVTISAPYVILRGVTMKGAQINGVELFQGAHDIVIEGNDISGWGRFSNRPGDATGLPAWDMGVDMDAGIRARCSDFSLERVVIQRNKIHDPRYGAGSWDWGHPIGPQGITFSYCGGNNVFRYNEITSADHRHYFNDGIGGEDNYTQTGFPNYDTDIYGNIISGVMDDAIEAEGGNRNVRIWGNYLDQTGTGIATTVAAWGPVYIFRNVYNHSQMRYQAGSETADRGPFFKSGSQDSTIGGGRRYVFHNTSLQPMQTGVTTGLGAGGGVQGTGNNALTNTVSRNNIYHIFKPNWESIVQNPGGWGNDVDYDMYNGVVSAGTGAEGNGVKVDAPQYQSGNGAVSGSGGMYQLAPGAPGYGKAVKLPNFNDASAAPDIGAHQSGTPAMKFGVNAGK